MGPLVGLLQVGARDVRVDLGRGERGVPQELLDGHEVGPRAQQMGREGVAQGVRRDGGAFGEPRQGSAHDALDLPAGEAPGRVASNENESRRRRCEDAPALSISSGSAI